ncbi:MAG: imidazole glycerol phosphate synthase subunit HisH [Chloroflexi bacterium]|nr:imidazole glycerol phosphate synthase subunit HisH [Chloroflexota bacterium]
MIAVVDYGAGNLRSVIRALEYAGAEPKITADPKDLSNAEAIVLPGVGAAQAIMSGLRERGLVESLLTNIRKGKPFLGLCLGLQALLTYSDEGGRQDCLNVIPGAVHKLPDGLKVPQMGWNQVEARVEHPLLNGIPDGSSFYFVHSFYVQPTDDSTVVATTEYGVRFPSILARDNVFATQFHPEKSGGHGLVIYRNFVKQAKACS